MYIATADPDMTIFFHITFFFSLASEITIAKFLWLHIILLILRKLHQLDQC